MMRLKIGERCELLAVGKELDHPRREEARRCLYGKVRIKTTILHQHATIHLLYDGFEEVGDAGAMELKSPNVSEVSTGVESNESLVIDARKTQVQTLL